MIKIHGSKGVATGTKYDMNLTTFLFAKSLYDAPVSSDIFAAKINPLLPGILHEMLTIYLIVACLHAYLLIHCTVTAISASKINTALIRIH